MVKQGQYDLTADSMRLRNQRPLFGGDDYTFEFTYVDENGDPIDISGATIHMTIKFDVGDNDPGILQKSGTVVDGPAGRFDVAIVSSDVVGPQRIGAYYDVQMTLSGETETILHGDIEFLPNITQTTP